MNSNRGQITNDLRTKLLGHLRNVVPTLQINHTAEEIERLCFERSNQDSDVYMKNVMKFSENRKRQLTESQATQGNVIFANMRQSVPGQTEFFQTAETVVPMQIVSSTAQMNVIPAQFTNKNGNIINASPPNRQIIPLRTDQFQTQTQIIQSPLLIANGNSVNGTVLINGRLTRNNSMGSSDMLTSVANNSITNVMQTDSGNGIVSTGQTPTLTPPATVMMASPVRTSTVKTVTRSASSPVTGTLSLQVVGLNSRSLPISSNNNFGNGDSNSLGTPVPSNGSQQQLSTKQQLSPQEKAIINDELIKFRQKYSQSLDFALANSSEENNKDNHKYWKVIKKVLDGNGSSGPIINRNHLERIREFLEKAEHFCKSYTEQKKQKLSSTDDVNLDQAFDDIIAQMQKTPCDAIEKTQKSFIQYILQNRSDMKYLLPSHLRNAEASQLPQQPNEVASVSMDEDEFAFIDQVPVDGMEFFHSEQKVSPLDAFGSLRDDLEPDMRLGVPDFVRESEMLQSEFDICILSQYQEQFDDNWTVHDYSGIDNWHQGVFVAVTYRGSNTGHTLLLRLSADYSTSGNVDWNINAQTTGSSSAAYSSVCNAVANNFSRLRNTIESIPLTVVLSYYKRSVATAMMASA